MNYSRLSAMPFRVSKRKQIERRTSKHDVFIPSNSTARRISFIRVSGYRAQEWRKTDLHLYLYIYIYSGTVAPQWPLRKKQSEKVRIVPQRTSRTRQKTCEALFTVRSSTDKPRLGRGVSRSLCYVLEFVESSHADTANRARR